MLTALREANVLKPLFILGSLKLLKQKKPETETVSGTKNSRYHPDYRQTPISHQAQLSHSHGNGASGAAYCYFGSSVQERVVAISPG